MSFYLGVDPGASGGCAVVNEKGRIAKVFKFKGLTLADLAHEMVICKRDFNPKTAFLERVSAMPKQGVSSTFKFGQSYGQLEMCLVGLKIPYQLITPTKWMTKMNCRTGGDKNVSKIAAQRRWPEQKITHAVADAMLLADCARMLDMGL